MQDHRDLLAELISTCCPCNWGDDEAAETWLAAERATGVPLPDPDYSGNIEARKRLSK